MQDISTGAGRTVLFVSHNMGIIKSLCSTSVLLQNGEIILFDKTDKVISTYINSGQTNSKFGTIPKDFYHNIWVKDMAIINRIVLKNSENNEIESIRLLETIIIETHVEVFDEINDAIITLWLNDEYSENIIYLTSQKLKDENYLTLKKGNNIISTKIEQKLLPGNYSVSVSVFDKNGYPYDGISCFGKFSIEKFGIENLKYRWDKSFGKTYENAEFEIVRKE
jgi:lipopolysaccharide transport system ATP-binding protein